MTGLPVNPILTGLSVKWCQSYSPLRSTIPGFSRKPVPENWWRRQDSNSRTRLTPRVHLRPVALSTELLPHIAPILTGLRVFDAHCLASHVMPLLTACTLAELPSLSVVAMRSFISDKPVVTGGEGRDLNPSIASMIRQPRAA